MAITSLPNSAETPDVVLTATGAARVGAVLSLPQVATVPSEQSARLCLNPAEMAVTFLPYSAEIPEVAFTATGSVRLPPGMLSPSCPSSLPPQATTLPSEHRARL